MDNLKAINKFLGYASDCLVASRREDVEEVYTIHDLDEIEDVGDVWCEIEQVKNDIYCVEIKIWHACIYEYIPATRDSAGDVDLVEVEKSTNVVWAAKALLEELYKRKLENDAQHTMIEMGL